MKPLDAWEARWAPYDDQTYQTALQYVRPNDVVLDIGAGDLRFSRRLATVSERVFAIELQPNLLTDKLPTPDNLTIICADARRIPWPRGITLGVLLMRHCTCLGDYAGRLRDLGCKRLVTNARWGMDVEVMDLGHRMSWSKIDLGFYACTCGATGFVPGPAHLITEKQIWRVSEVETCPACDRSACFPLEAVAWPS